MEKSILQQSLDSLEQVALRTPPGENAVVSVEALNTLLLNYYHLRSRMVKAEEALLAIRKSVQKSDTDLEGVL